MEYQFQWEKELSEKGYKLKHRGSVLKRGSAIPKVNGTYPANVEIYSKTDADHCIVFYCHPNRGEIHPEHYSGKIHILLGKLKVCGCTINGISDVV